MNITDNPGWSLRAACWLTRTDPHILKRLPLVFRFQVYSNAILLLTVVSVACFTWGAFFAQFWPLHIVIPLTVLVIVWLMIVDQTMASARWEPRGVLRDPSKRWTFRVLSASVFLLLFRLSIGIVASWATSISATMTMNAESIEVRLEQGVETHNKQILEDGNDEKAKLRRDRLTLVQEAVKQAEAERGQIDAALGDARQRRDSAKRDFHQRQRELNCELNGGPGCRQGDGVRAREARLRMDEASENLRQAEKDERALDSRRAIADSKLEEAKRLLRDRDADVQREEAAIDARVNGKLEHLRKDPFLSYQALQEILEKDEGARFYYHLILALLLTLELSYVLCREYLAHANPHDEWLTTATLAERARAWAQYRETLRGLDARAARPAEERFRVVPRFGAA